MPKVAITQNQHIETAIAEALQHLDLDGIIDGKIVAVKPNDTWASREDLTAVTQADTLRAVLRFLRTLRPKTLIVSGGAGAAETEEVFRLSGMMQVLEEEGAEFFDHNRPPFQEVALPYAPEKQVAGPQKAVMVNPRVLEYETLVSLDRHAFFGDMHSFIAAMAKRFPAKLALIVGHPAMIGPGADWGPHL